MLRPRFAPSLVLASLLTLAAAQPAAAQAPTDPVARVVSIVIQSIEPEDGGLVATALVTLDVAGETVERVVEIPLNLGGSPGAEGECDILNLSLGPIHLDLLGLVVDLDDCDGGPVTVDITGEEGALLGDLLCSIAGLLDGGLNLEDLLGLLSPTELGLLTDTLQDVLNLVLDRIVNADEAVAAAGAHAEQADAQGSGHQCDILNLEIPEGVHLDLLGLVVDTSPICLDVYAERGPGNLLGNLLCNVVGLLDRGNGGNAVQALLRRVGRILAGL
jgi:hypothetical protein